MPVVVKVTDKNVDRLIDANYNRAKEGLRVCEDVCRFVWDAKSHTRGYKNARHRLTDIMGALQLSRMIQARNTAGDTGRGSTGGELKRTGARDIFYANSQRVKESVRVLEEFTKLNHQRTSEDLNRLRYRIYALEKNVLKQC